MINLAYRVEDFFIDGDRTDETEIAALLTEPDAAYLVIDDPGGRGVLLGAIFVRAKGERGYFGPLAVHPAAQGQGIGKRLVEAAEEWCRARGCRHLDLDIVNVRAELPPFYEKLGYAATGTAEFLKGHKLKQPVHLVLMSKVLPIGDSR